MGEELRVERDAAAIVRVERAVDVLERRAVRARDRLDRQRHAGRLGDVEARGKEREVLVEPAVADRELPEVEDHERCAEARREPAIALELRERRSGVLEQLGADALVEVRRLEAKPGRAEVVLDARGVPDAADAELETVDVEARAPLDDRA